jgi:23S rRNA (cytosine1962-C5)-methyltransferase
MKSINILTLAPSKDYELIDSGGEQKLERFGSVVLSRPDPQALWMKGLPETEWKKLAQGSFTREAKDGNWNFKADVSDEEKKKWQIDFGGLKFWIKPTAFKHTGLFPEQALNWDWTREIISKALKNVTAKDPAAKIEVLNLFGYTGGATLACAQAGASVVHVDGSKAAITWARENAEISGLADKPIRWILEDARLFVEREVKRGRTYQGIIMDPPAFGHGADKELWKIEEHLIPLIEDCMKLFSSDATAGTNSPTSPLFFILNGYSAGYSSIAYQNILMKIQQKFGGTIEIAELAIGEKTGTRLLPCGICARWKK